MKRFTKNISASALILSLIFATGTFFAPLYSQAQTQTPYQQCVEQESQRPNPDPSRCVGLAGAPADASKLTGGENVNNSGWWMNNVIQPVVAWIVTQILRIVSLLTGIGGLFLNGAIYHTVVNVSQNYAGLPAINETWKVIRDVSNMGFIFVLLYAAIMTMVGQGEDNKKLIVRIVAVAVLVNFSLFFTKIVIDIANLLTLTFYDAIVPNAAQNGLTGMGLSNAFMQHLNLQNLYHIDGANNLNVSAIITTGIMGSILLLIGSFVFFAVAIMFVIRYVVLIVVLILSPIAFVSFVLPQMDRYRKQWSEALINQAFFAPVYMMLTWVTLKVLSGVTGQLGAGRLSNVGTLGLATGGVTGDVQGFFPTFINFVIVIAFLIISLVVAKEWSSKTAGGVGKLTSWATGAAGSATFGVAGRFGRGTIGRVGQQVAESEWLKDKAPTSRLARLSLAAGQKTGGASFDMRNAGFTSQLGAGKGQKGGFAKDLKEKIESEKKYAETLKPSDLLVSQADKELDDAKKNGTREQIAAAQARVDKLKGVSEDDARKREISRRREEALANNGYLSEKAAKKEVASAETERLRAIMTLQRSENLTRKQAEDKVDAAGTGLKLKTTKSVLNERKESYAKNKESQTVTIPLVDQNPWIAPVKIEVPFSLTGRHGFIGPVKRERLEEALSIRKTMKEKKSAEKIVEEIEKSAKKAAEDEDNEPETTTPPPAAPTPPTP